MATEYVAEGLLGALETYDLKGARILIARAAVARDLLAGKILIDTTMPLVPPKVARLSTRGAADLSVPSAPGRPLAACQSPVTLRIYVASLLAMR